MKTIKKEIFIMLIIFFVLAVVLIVFEKTSGEKSSTHKSDFDNQMGYDRISDVTEENYPK
jgi:preprotein translocase subunit SecG